MAWEATHLLVLVLLVHLASGLLEPMLLQKLEGETISLKCQYQRSRDSTKLKVWCKEKSEHSCTILVTSSKYPERMSRYSIQDYQRKNYFIINMLELKTADSGTYWCGALDSRGIVNIFRIFHLMVSQAPPLSTTTSTVTTTVQISATHLTTNRPSFQSSTNNWEFILAGVVVAVLLLVVLAVFIILYHRKVRKRAGKGEGESHHISDDLSVQKEITGFEQQVVSDKDAEDIHYASLTHLDHSGTEDSIYVNTYRNWRTIPDPLLFVEYVNIAGNKPRSSRMAALERSLRN